MSASRRLILLVVVAGLGACATPRRASAPAVAAEAEPVVEAPATAPAAATAVGRERQGDAADEPAQPYDTARAGLAVDVPRGWRTKRRDMALVYEGPMRVPSVVLFEPKARTLDDAVEGLAAELRAPLGAVRITKQPEATTIAGYEAYVAEGSGRAEGFPMRWRATIVAGERLTVLLGLTPSFFWGANRGKVVAFERGVRRADVDTAELAARETAAR